MTAFLYHHPARAIDGATVYPGAWLTISDPDSGEPVELWADTEHITRLSNPVQADAAGRFPPLYSRLLNPIYVDNDPPRDHAGALMPWALLAFYTEDTTELAPVYVDAEQSEEAANPATADANGEFDPVYLDRGMRYRVRLLDQHGRLIYDHPVRRTCVPRDDTAPGSFMAKLESNGSTVWERTINVYTPLVYGYPGVVRSVYFTTNSEQEQPYDATWDRPDGVERIAVLLVGHGGRSRHSAFGTWSWRGAPGGGGGGQVKYLPTVPAGSNGAIRTSPGNAAGGFGLYNTSLTFTAPASVTYTAYDADQGTSWYSSGGAVNQIITTNPPDYVSPKLGFPPELGGGGSSGGLAHAVGVGTDNALAYGGGGGGAGAPGQNAEVGGEGGDGLYFGHIFGDDIGDEGWFAGGGGGGYNLVDTTYAPAGGRGGGGGGMRTEEAAKGINGTGGGSGGWYNGAAYPPPGGESRFQYGGSGAVVILHYDPDVHGPGYWPYCED